MERKNGGRGLIGGGRSPNTTPKTGATHPAPQAKETAVPTANTSRLPKNKKLITPYKRHVWTAIQKKP